MAYERKEILEYWNRNDTESMYDKHLLNAEVELIKRWISPNTKICDMGCGEGESTLIYSNIPGVVVHAFDFSETRLRLARGRLGGQKNVFLKKVDFLKEYCFDKDYDIVVSQRFLINIAEWNLQKNALLNLMAMLKPGGKLLMLEGSIQGTNSLNEFRKAWGLDPIPIKWHNLFFDGHMLIEFMQRHGYKLVEEAGLGAYFFLTRGVRPNLDKNLNWDCDFNRKASKKRMKNLLKFCTNFSRLNLWVFQK